MKTLPALVLAVALGFVAGCTTPTSAPIPSPAPPEPQQNGNGPEPAPGPQPLPPSADVVAPSQVGVVGLDAYTFVGPPTRTTYPNSWTVLTSIGYESAYDETFRAPAWVAYHLTGSAGTSAPRPSGYATDTRSPAAVAASDFPPGYDHGHMAPNEAIAEFYGTTAQNQTFLMTNMLPQKHGLNAGPWKSLETLEYSAWEPEFRDVWVIDGPVYTTADGQPIKPTDRYGAKQVSVPPFCFKIIVAKDTAGSIQTLAFIMPQEPGTGHKPKDFLTSIREVEKRTGLNFFSNLPQAGQDEIEKKTAADVWP